MEQGLDRMTNRHKHKNKRRNITIAAVIVLAVIFAASLFLRSFNSGDTVTITVPEGASSSVIARQLKEEGVIHSKLWFLLRLSLSEYKGKLQYGTFKFDKNDSLNEIFETLATKGAKKNTVKLVIPEGYSVNMIKERVCGMGLCTDSEFDRAVNAEYDYSFLNVIPDDKDLSCRLEGFLYPSTYEFYSDADAETVINTLLKEFEKQTKDLNIPDGNMYEIITKASMIEREAKLDSERRTIAGVIENRLNANMLLQIDATVVYAISDGMYNVDRVYYKDLKIDSKYNTYKYKGLPAGPICSPSIKSIKAAQSPEKHKYLYYHTDTDKNNGSHIFTETYDEHTDSQKQ